MNISISKKRIIEIFNILDFKQVLDIILFPIIALISLLAKPFCKDIWIVAENPNEACDNGYIFFKYLRENRKDINAYYVIKHRSKDYKKIESLGNIIKYRSLKHWVYYLNASKIIVTQKYANPSAALFYILHIKNILKTPRIFLQHGVMVNDCKMFYYNRTNFRLFICGARTEYEYIKNYYGYPTENVKYTGLARFDNLDLSEDKRGNIILIAPTWRKWIRNQKSFDLFMQNYYKLLDNKELIKYLEKRNIQLKVVLHKNMKKFKINKNTLSKNITINHNEEVDIQNLLNNVDLLITDYSSLFMDIAYRKRPIIYYQFDKKEYTQKQLPEGYFLYERDGFGEVLVDSKLIIDKIKNYLENDLKIEEIYLTRMNEFFERKDKNNCKRILEEIEKI